MFAAEHAIWFLRRSEMKKAYGAEIVLKVGWLAHASKIKTDLKKMLVSRYYKDQRNQLVFAIKGDKGLPEEQAVFRVHTDAYHLLMRSLPSFYHVTWDRRRGLENRS